MTITAKIAFFKNEFIATLSDGRHIERGCWREMAKALYENGVNGNAIEYVWHTGQRMITAGQQVALRAEIQRLGHVGPVAAPRTTARRIAAA